MSFGIPPLLRATQRNINKFQILVSDLNILPGLFSRGRWGVYLGNQPVVIADSVVDLEYHQDWLVAQYPMERGAFQSYNKVETPFLARVRLTRGGTVSDRAAFLEALEAAGASLDLYDIISPEKTYQGVNITRLEYRRSAARGAGMITADLTLVQVRETVTTHFAATSAPSGANPVNGGSVQAQAPSAAQIAGTLGFD